MLSTSYFIFYGEIASRPISRAAITFAAKMFAAQMFIVKTPRTRRHWHKAFKIVKEFDFPPRNLYTLVQMNLVWEWHKDIFHTLKNSSI